MNISELSNRRPILTFVMNIIIVLFGAIGFTFLGVRDYPAIDPPNINVRTSYSGANADIIESQITEPLALASSIARFAGSRMVLSAIPGFRCASPWALLWSPLCGLVGSDFATF